MAGRDTSGRFVCAAPPENTNERESEMGKMELKKKWSACGLRKTDFWIIAAVVLVSFFSFAYSDLYVTGNRSWLYYSRPFLEFYDASYEWAGNYGANYYVPFIIIEEVLKTSYEAFFLKNLSLLFSDFVIH